MSPPSFFSRVPASARPSPVSAPFRASLAPSVLSVRGESQAPPRRGPAVTLAGAADDT